VNAELLGRLSQPVIRWGYISDHLHEIRSALVQHLELTLSAVGVGLVPSSLLAAVALRFRFTFQPLNAITGIMYAIPSLALFILLSPITGLTILTSEIALVSYTLLILFRNTLEGLRGVPAEVREAAVGMGLTRRQVLMRVELPLALPAIVAGLRIATVTVISLATVAAFIDDEGLGSPIFRAIQSNVFKTELLAAGGLAVILALLADGLLVLAQRLVTPWARRQRA
jgi:osmoprotectant transport system permease protein